MEIIYRGFVIAMLLIMKFIRARTQRVGDPTGNQEAFRNDRLDTLILSLLGTFGSLAVLVYGLAPQWIEWARIDLPNWLRWIGVTIGIGSLALLAWSDYHLGANFSPTLRVRRQHQLIQSGPYRRIRHPIYSSGILIMIAMLLVSANWLVGLCWSGVLPLYWRRIPREEAMMLDNFGAEYRQYLDRTGRIWPKL